MKKTLLTNLKFIALGLVIAISASYAYAAWGGPLTNTFQTNTSTPPTNNTDAPVNVSALDQFKPIGTCGAGSCGGLALGGSLLAAKDAEFDGSTFLSGVVGGGSDGLFPATTMLYFGFNGNPTPITLSGMLAANSTLKSSALANADGTKTLCSDAEGKISFCDALADMCSNISGAQTTVPDGYQQNTDGTCSKAPKRFLARVTYQEYNSYPSDIVGNVVNGTYQDHVPYVVPNGSVVKIPPLVAQIGIYNGSAGCRSLSGCNEWILNQIPGILPTSFSNSGTRLMTVGEDGSYHFKISTSGKIGIRGKKVTDDNRIEADFYMKINSGNWVRLDNVTAHDYAHEEYPVPGKLSADFFAFFPSGSGALSVTGNGDQFRYMQYSLNFDQTLHLNRGDTVDVYALIYGSSTYSGLTAYGDNNFYYSIDSDNTTFDITEIPD